MEKNDILWDDVLDPQENPAIEKILVLINKFDNSFVINYFGFGVEDEYTYGGSNFDEWAIYNFPEIKGPGLYLIEIRWRLYRDWETGRVDDTEIEYVSHKKIIGYDKLFSSDIFCGKKE